MSNPVVIKSPKGGKATIKSRWKKLAAFSATVNEAGHVVFDRIEEDGWTGAIQNYHPSPQYFKARKKAIPKKVTDERGKEITYAMVKDQRKFKEYYEKEIAWPSFLMVLLKSLTIKDGVRLRLPEFRILPKGHFADESKHIPAGQDVLHGHMANQITCLPMLYNGPVRASFVHVPPCTGEEDKEARSA